MEIIGLIAEYNPLHNGHIYQIKKIKELYPDSLIILILNGYFLERGTISYMTKEDKVTASLNESIDLIVELPCFYGTQSADIFAYQSINILNELHITHLAFGSESNDLATISSLANTFSNPEYQENVQKNLSTGLNYPTALAKSLNTSFTFNPNDLLAISYLKALNKINPQIKPLLIKRTNSYHDLESNDSIISASNIRHKFLNHEPISHTTLYSKYLIEPDFSLLFSLISYKVFSSSNLAIYLDMDEGLEYRLKKVLPTVHKYDDLVMALKTKRYTFNKINRLLTHLLLGITKEDNTSTYPPYIHYLGFNKKGQSYIHSLSLNPSSYLDHPLYQVELRASRIYDLIMHTHTYTYELRHQPKRI